MTLFKRVFNKHTTGKTVAPVPSYQVEEPEAELKFDEEILAGIADVVGDQSLQTPINSVDQIGAQNATRRPETEIVIQRGDQPNVKPPPPPLELNPGLAVEPGMAERAAQAQREIEKSQKQRDLKLVTNPSDERLATPPPRQNGPQSNEVAAPATARPGRAARRIRTRMLGFGQGIEAAADPFEKQKDEPSQPAQKFPVGWMVVVAGPGKGHFFAIFNGVSTIGRGIDQTVALDFGDSSVSRERHAAVAYDDENNRFFLGHGGKSNIVRLNDRPVLITEDLADGDIVRIGETTLRFTALCGASFAWGKPCNDET